MATLSTSFLSNIHPRIQEELFRKMDLAERGSLTSQDVKSCWAKMTSGTTHKDGESDAVVLLAGELNSNKIREGFDENYNWSTNREGKLNFGESVADSNGEIYRPMAGITGIESSTDGSFGSLKKATVNWQCWSMNDLARLSKAFMTIGRSVMVEWGWSGEPGGILTYAPDEMNRAIREGKRRIIENKGNYEIVSGVIKNFSWNANQDGGFDCSTEIISHGTPMVEGGMGNDTNIQVPEGGVDESEEARAALAQLGFNNLQKYLNSIKLEILRHLNPGTFISDPWIGKDKVEGADITKRKNIEIRDSKLQFGSVTFVSWGYFEDNILSKYLGRVTTSSDVKYSFRSIDAIEDGSGGYRYESVKCTNHPKLETADSRICQFPGQGKGRKGDFENFAVPGSGGKLGYLRNIKLNVEFIRACWLDADTMQAGLDKMFKGINDIAGDIFDFKIMADDCQTSNLRIVDVNVCENDVQTLLNDRSSVGNYDGLFYFPYMNAQNTLVRSQTLAAKIPNSAMYSAMYGTNKVNVSSAEPVRIDDASIEAFTEHLRDGKIVDKFLGGFGVPDARYKNYGNFAGELPDDSKEVNVAADLRPNVGPPLVEGATLEGIMQIRDQKEAEAGAEDAEDKRWYEKVWGFGEDLVAGAGELLDKAAKGVESLYRATVAGLSEYDQGEIMTSFNIAKMIKNIQYDDKDPVIYDTDFVLPLELSLEIDGTGGIFPGNAFGTDYIPEDYKPHPHPEVKSHTKGAVFMVKGINHSVSAEGWTTSFEGIMRCSIPPQK